MGVSVGRSAEMLSLTLRFRLDAAFHVLRSNLASLLSNAVRLGSRRARRRSLAAIFVKRSQQNAIS
jgi:hypothetical protein